MNFPKWTSLKLIAAVLGIAAAGVPMVMLNAWLGKQGDQQLSVTAAWAMGSTEIQIGKTVEALGKLAARGVDSCRPAHIEALRQTVMVTDPVKEAMLIGSNGQVLCSDTGPGAGRLQVVSSVRVTPDVGLDVVRIPDHSEHFLRIRKSTRPDKPTLAAIVPASLLLPQPTMRDGRLVGYARLNLPDGTLVGESGMAAGPANAQGSQFLQQARSQPYRLVLTVSMPRNTTVSNYDELRRLGMLLSGMIALIILLFAMVLPRNQTENPVVEMERAIAADEFVPYYHPVVDIQTGGLIGAEVLVRWRKPDGTFAEPETFVPLMETGGMILDLTRSLMKRACVDLGAAMERRPSLTLAFNVAPKHFDDALILNDVGTIFGGSQIKLSQIVLELTERYEIADLGVMRRTIAALQGLGCKVAMDDVGTGHSGLSYLLKLGVDVIKIDRVFIEAIGTEGHSRTIIETLIDLAKNMRMDIVAEGVENFDQVSYLRDRGIRAAQGFAFAPPLPAPSFLKLLEAMDPVAGAEPSAGGANPAEKAPGKTAAKKSAA
ncbi:MAG: EAL domain-containing protein [Alphaproteobacteria bacterium]|nr:EAL domain-containing protein [Alphaproteobacteria bacterium]